MHKLNETLVQILELTQRECFPKDIRQLSENNYINSRSNLLSLSPFLDDEGLIHVGGRLKYSPLHSDQKYPTVLPTSHHVTELILRGKHIFHLHSGTQATLNAVLSKCWPLSAKNAIKKVIQNV